MRGRDPMLPEEGARPAPWERQPHEDPDSWELFRAFSSAEPGISLVAFSTRLGLNPAMVGRLAAKYRWRARRAALTDHLSREGLAAAEEEARDAGREIGRHFARLVDLAGEAIARAAAADELPDLKTALAILDSAAKHVALANGRPTQIVDLRGATPEALHAAREALLALEAPPAEPEAPKA